MSMLLSLRGKCFSPHLFSAGRSILLSNQQHGPDSTYLVKRLVEKPYSTLDLKEMKETVSVLSKLVNKQELSSFYNDLTESQIQMDKMNGEFEMYMDKMLNKLRRERNERLTFQMDKMNGELEMYMDKMLNKIEKLGRERNEILTLRKTIISETENMLNLGSHDEDK